MKKQHVCRGLIYVMGMLILALGLSISTRTNLGVSPLISVAFYVSKVTNRNIGNITLLWYAIFVAVEIVCHIKKKRYQEIPKDILQIPVSIVLTRFMNVFTGIIPEMTGNLVIRVFFLAIAIILIGLGIVFTLNVRLIPNPGDGIVQALADLFARKVSTMKNILDAVCTLLTVIMSLVFSHKIIGIGLGTVLSVIFVGRVVALGNHFLKEKMLRACGLEP